MGKPAEGTKRGPNDLEPSEAKSRPESKGTVAERGRKNHLTSFKAPSEEARNSLLGKGEVLLSF